MTLKIQGIVAEHFARSNSMARLIQHQIDSGMYDEFIPLLEKGVVIDLGANIGLFSVFAAKHANIVYAVEPTKSHQKIFETLLADNNIYNVNLVKAAIATSNEELDFYESPINSTMNSLFNYGPASMTSYKVQCTTLEELCLQALQPISFIKMDIEGSEKFLLEDQNFFETLKNNVNSIFIEVHEVDGKSFNTVVQEWMLILQTIYSNVKRIGIDGILAAN